MNRLSKGSYPRPLKPAESGKALTSLLDDPFHFNGDAPVADLSASARAINEPGTTVPELVTQLLEASILLADDWDSLPERERNEVLASQSTSSCLAKLASLGVLTQYQAARINARTVFGLVMGNYRVLDRLGAGGMGIVLKAEHIDLRRPVAIKVFPTSADHDPKLLSRFLGEMRAVALLRHPNVVAAIDAGKLVGAPAAASMVRYFVMEYVQGKDLEQLVKESGPMDSARACDVGYQVASALAEVDKFHLVHRDIKPSNILLTPEGQAKLLDFGLARRFDQRLTQPGAVLGTLDYMAPEQVEDASSVDIRADIYGLGGTLFWCLTGTPPFPPLASMAEELARRLTQSPPLVRSLRPDLPAELEAVLARMMAIKPSDRFPTPDALMRALLPFCAPHVRDRAGLTAKETVRLKRDSARSTTDEATAPRALVVDDQAAVRTFCRQVLAAEGIVCDEASSGYEALELVRGRPCDLVLTDVHMPEMSGLELLLELRQHPPCPNLKVIMISGLASSDEMAQMLMAGADDYLTKPFSMVQLQGRVKAALRLKAAQDRSQMLTQHLLKINNELEENLNARDADLVHARNALVLALAKLVGHRDTETGAHLMRLQRYCRTLAEAAAESSAFAGQIDGPFIEMLECCAPLHDIGKLGLPDHILLKPGKLTSEERLIMQTHTVMGADTLRDVARQHGFAIVFLQMAVDITRHHHERFDGTGYPDRLAGNDIPLAARIVAVADVYDALRSRRVYKPALSHTATLQMMLEGSPGQFDPALIEVFKSCADAFDRIYGELAD